MRDFLIKNRILLAVITYLTLLFLLFILFVKPLISEIKNKNINIQEKIADSENNQEKISKIPALRDQYELISKEEEKIASLLFRDDVVKLIERIERISEETGNKSSIELAESVVDKKESSKSKKEKENEEKNLISSLSSDKYITMNIKISGEYDNFIDFVRKLENLEYYSDVISIKLSKDLEKKSVENPFETDLSGGDGVNTNVKDEISSTISVIFYLEN